MDVKTWVNDNAYSMGSNAISGDWAIDADDVEAKMLEMEAEIEALKEEAARYAL